jgi:hypothetical protein
LKGSHFPLKLSFQGSNTIFFKPEPALYPKLAIAEGWMTVLMHGSLISILIKAKVSLEEARIFPDILISCMPTLSKSSVRTLIRIYDESQVIQVLPS